MCTSDRFIAQIFPTVCPPQVLGGPSLGCPLSRARFAARIGQNLKLFGRGVANHAKATGGLVLTFLMEGVKYFVISAHCDFRTLCFAQIFPRVCPPQVLGGPSLGCPLSRAQEESEKKHCWPSGVACAHCNREVKSSTPPQEDLAFQCFVAHASFFLAQELLYNNINIIL